ncbi:quinolinate synthase NadA [Candidatus Bathyarchaeota archaeon]|nr:quinolinate synthase NadA [Candidatus Bathyarchaeota archaeon]
MVTDDTILVKKIRRLKAEKKAIILAHNYQRSEVQDVADYVGDSIELSRKAMQEKDAQMIVFCAVDFMAESGAILNPEKKIVVPNPHAMCPMAQMLPPRVARQWREKYPKLPFVLYVNTLAETRSLGDICCTSANAVEVIRSLDDDAVLFGPDYNLAKYVEKKTGKTIIPVPDHGFCPTHSTILKEDALLTKEQYPDALLLAHPECTPEVQEVADFVGSTSQMCRYVSQCPAKRMIIGTEVGILHRLRKENPDREFIPAYEGAVCPNMKKNTLESVYLALRDETYPVVVPTPIAAKARLCLERMFAVR